MALDEPAQDEQAVPVNGIDVLIEEELKPIAERTVLDFYHTPYGDMFDIDSGLSC